MAQGRQQQIKANINGGTTAPTGRGSLGPGKAIRPIGQPTIGGLGQNHPAPQGKPAAALGVAPAGPAPLPWDVAAANDEAGAQKKLANSLTGLDSGWLRTQQEYGIDGPWADPASNPTSRSALLQRSYNNAKAGTLNSAGHKLYAGSYINNQNANTHQFDLGRNELEKQYAGANAEYIRGKQDAGDQFNEEISQAGWNRVDAGISEPVEPAAAPGKPAKPGKPKNQRQQTIKKNISGGTRKVG